MNRFEIRFMGIWVVWDTKWGISVYRSVDRDTCEVMLETYQENYYV